MKRRVAGLPPVSATAFNDKVRERKLETAVAASPKNSTCSICNKTYATENAYQSHLSSKRHKEKELESLHADVVKPVTKAKHTTSPSVNSQAILVEEPVDSEDSPESSDLLLSIDAKIAAARSRLSPTSCLFCSNSSTSLRDNLEHMANAHSFFIPDTEYLHDAIGLITYLGEKIAVGNVCIYCNAQSRDFRTVDAVRKHMLDKSHCKIAYNSEDDKLEVSDYYDFTPSYPTDSRIDHDDEDWEDVDDEDMDGLLDSDSRTSGPTDRSSGQLTYGDSPFELVLPSGARIGHRTLKHYYAQSFPNKIQTSQRNSGAALVRQLLSDRNSTAVPVGGGYGAFGAGMQVVKARNAGEAREAGRHVREFRDQKRREDFKTRVGFANNYQKHFRDPLLQ